MSKRLDIQGDRYGKLVVIELHEVVNWKTRWLCQCDCGNTIVAVSGNLRNGHTQSCGCYLKERITKHGLSVPFKSYYKVWASIKDRCFNSSNKGYHNYGGRGITMCDRWANSFPDFFEDIGLKPSPKHSLERVDNDGHYEKCNIVWALPAQQMRNRRNNVWIEHNGERLIVQDWAKKFPNTSPNAFAIYVRKHGLPKAIARYSI